MVIHLTLIYLSAAGELKTKPTQHSVKALWKVGLKPILVCRTEHKLSEDLRKKLALFCNVRPEAVIQSIDVDTIYDVPLKMLEEGLDRVVLDQLKLTAKSNLIWIIGNLFEKIQKSQAKSQNRFGGKICRVTRFLQIDTRSLIHAGAINEAEVEVVEHPL